MKANRKGKSRHRGSKPSAARIRACLRNVTTLHICTGMVDTLLQLRGRLDRVGMLLSGLCAVHCLAGLLFVTVLGLGGGVLLDPSIHRIGLAVALIVGGATIGLGAIRHGRRLPLLLGSIGLMLMAIALWFGHSAYEAALTVPGVALVALAHFVNIRGHSHRPC
jgi:hypothetical protein